MLGKDPFSFDHHESVSDEHFVFWSLHPDAESHKLEAFVSAEPDVLGVRREIQARMEPGGDLEECQVRLIRYRSSEQHFETLAPHYVADPSEPRGES